MVHVVVKSKMVDTCKNQRHDSRNRVEAMPYPSYTIGIYYIIVEAGRISTGKREEAIKQTFILHASGEPRPRW